MSGKRPEHRAPPEIFYDATEARKYSANTRMMEIQSKLSERAIELLMLPEDTPCLLLDIGCGSGLSGECLTEQGHIWMGLDISNSMLDVALEREVEGDLCLSDMGDGVPLRFGVLDGVISISALQWLCNADKRHHHVPTRLKKFFSTLYSAMGRGSRAVFQLYPENSTQLELITLHAMKAGFLGGMVVDYPNSSKAKKMYLVLMAGGAMTQLPKGLGTEDSQQTEAKFVDARERLRGARKNKKSAKKSKDWIKDKKERSTRQGRDTRPESRYTGRKRSSKFW